MNNSISRSLRCSKSDSYRALYLFNRRDREVPKFRSSFGLIFRVIFSRNAAIFSRVGGCRNFLGTFGLYLGDWRVEGKESVGLQGQNVKKMITRTLGRGNGSTALVRATEMDEKGNGPFESHGITSCHRKEIEFWEKTVIFNRLQVYTVSQPRRQQSEQTLVSSLISRHTVFHSSQFYLNGESLRHIISPF